MLFVLNSGLYVMARHLLLVLSISATDVTMAEITVICLKVDIVIPVITFTLSSFNSNSEQVHNSNTIIWEPNSKVTNEYVFSYPRYNESMFVQMLYM